VIDEVQSFATTRNVAYFGPRSTAVMLGGLCLLLLAITLFGIIGLTMYWVGQRRRQICMRRALGARRLDVLRYFHTENLLIAGSGALLGIALGLGANLWLVSHLELPRMSVAFVVAGAAVVLAVSQVAVFWPALRAASIPAAAPVTPGMVQVAQMTVETTAIDTSAIAPEQLEIPTGYKLNVPKPRATKQQSCSSSD
jgi:ABC-type antimicrobial peptide transport system permease subunit